MNNCKINNSRFSVRFCAIMKHYNVQTVGRAKQLLTFFDNNPNAKITYHLPGVGVRHTRRYKLQRELDSFEKEYMSK